MKRLFYVVATFAALVGAVCPAQPAGTINLSLSQQLDNQGNPLSGCKLQFYQAGTTTPQSAYSDVALTLPLPNPLECDSAGRLPQFFLADGQIKVRLTDSGGGATYIAADNLLVIGPSAGAAGGGSVDVTTVLATGDIKVKYGTGALAGFVRGNGRTIGSATSGAAERANADCQALFEYLWTADAALVVSGGRGATANADWLANKTMELPDYRGRFIAGLDDMGTTASGRLPTFTTLGTAGGNVLLSLTVAQANLPVINLNYSGLAISKPDVFINDPGHGHAVSPAYVQTDVSAITGGTTTGSKPGSNVVQNNFTGVTAVLTSTPTLSGTLPLGGSGTAMTASVIPPILPVTIYLKL